MKLWFLIALLRGQSAQPPSEPVQAPEPVKFSITHVEEGKPQFVRIFNLPEGTREIVLPPSYHTVTEAEQENRAEAATPKPIRILNLEEGTREIASPGNP